MKKEIRLLDFNNRIPMTFSVLYFDTIYRHMHSYPELIIVLKGEFDVEIKDRHYHAKEDDIFIVNAKELHSFKAKEEAMVLSLFIDPKAFGMTDEEVLSFAFHLNTMESGKLPKASEIRNLAYSIIKYNSVENVNSAYTNRAIAYSLFAQLVNNFSVDISESGNSASATDLYNELSVYINEHYKENISLASLAEHFHYSVGYLSRYFKQTFNANFVYYYDLVRVNYSIDDLVNNNLTIDEIAQIHGFDEARNYVRAFRSVFKGMTPSEYRKGYKVQKKTINLENLSKEALDIILQKYDAYTTERNRKTGDVKVIDEIISVENSEKLPELDNPGNMILDVGPFSVLIFAEIREEIAKMVDTCHYQYLVIKNIFSKRAGLFKKTTGEAEGFSICYPVLETMLAFFSQLKVKPYFRFEYDEKEESYQDFIAFTSFFMEWMKNSLPKEERKGWMISFGCKGSFTKMRKSEMHELMHGVTELYRYKQKNLSEMISVSPSFTRNDAYENGFIPEALECFRQARVFFRYMSFRFLNPEDSDYIQLDKNEVHDFVAYLKENKFYDGNDLFLEEINFTSKTDLLNDTLFSSNYFAKLLIDNSDNAKALTKSAFADSYPYDLSSNPFNGGPGFITYNRIHKASYNAFVLFSMLGKYLVKKSKNFIITKDDRHRLILLVNNYNHYADLYSKNEYYALTDRDRYKCFAKSRTINFEFTFKDVNRNSARIKTYYLSKDSGSPYDRTFSIGRIEDMTREERKALMSLSNIKYTIDRQKIKDGELILSLTCNPFETKLIEIEFQ